MKTVPSLKLAWASDWAALRELFQCDIIMGQTHAAAAATGGGFNDDGVADFAGHGHGLVFLGDRPVGTGRQGYVALLGQRLAGELGAEQFHRFHGGADEFNFATAAHFRKVGIF